MARTNTHTEGLAVEVRDLRKSYGEVEAVRGVSFEVSRGEVFCLLGPNGAGKTSIVEILEGYRTRTDGEARVLGFDPAHASRELHERVGIVLQQCGVQLDLTVTELVEMYGRYHARRRPVDEVIELVELGEKRGARAKSLSGGQLRRLDLALALVGDPDLIFLDEPTTGFDPGARRQAWATIRSLCELGKTVFLTTHYMDEAQHLADRVAVMAGGSLVALGPPDQLGGRDTGIATIRFLLPPGVAIADLPVAVTVEGDGVRFETDQPTPALHRLTGWAVERGIELPALIVSRPTLEDVYLELTTSDDEAADGWRS
jgi:ABC-2 type transport system ATP-binding protein